MSTIPAPKRFDWSEDCPFRINEKIHEELADLDDDEKARLTTSITARGCLDAIDVNADYEILDGRNRFWICEGERLPFNYRRWEQIGTLLESQIFAIDRQLERRNCGYEHKAKLIARLVKLQSQQREMVPGRARQAVADHLGLSYRTIVQYLQDNKIIGTLPPSVRKAIDQTPGLTRGQIKRIGLTERLAELDAELRMGRSQSLLDAWQKLHGRPLIRKFPPRPSKPELTEAERLPRRMQGLQRCIDRAVAQILEWKRLYEADAKFCQAVLDAYDKTRVALENWRQARLATGRTQEPKP